MTPLFYVGQPVDTRRNGPGVVKRVDSARGRLHAFTYVVALPGKRRPIVHYAHELQPRELPATTVRCRDCAHHNGAVDSHSSVFCRIALRARNVGRARLCADFAPRSHQQGD